LKPAVELTRSAGVLLHPTSLPGRKLGTEAERFVDWLAAAGQSWWQILPLVPPNRHGSPYASPSAFACWRGLLADPEAEVEPAEIDAFRERQSYWAPNWERYAGRGSLADQVRFEREWSALRAYAAKRNVRIIGDMPIYVAPRSAELRAHPGLFDTSEQAGAAPDPYTPQGQHWGNPLYRWPAHRAEGYRWWIERFRRTFELVDLTRVDHFRGFVAGWAVPDGSRPAEGHWRRGPGIELFRAVEGELGMLPIIVEDLGLITPPVYRLRDELGLPGMRVLQFGFDGRRANPDALANYPAYCVVYTGTHDHYPLAAWWELAGNSVRRRAGEQLTEAGIDDPEPAWAIMRLALSSRADLAIVQMQDVLGLGAKARLNTPGTEQGNWRWQLRPDQLTDALAERLREATAASGRATLQRRSGR
jgi:4-alpha-glucanotransferase